MKNLIEIRRNAYYDSVTLMLLSRKISQRDDYEKANICMGTDHNKSILKIQGFAEQDFNDAGPNDLILAFQVIDNISSEDAASLFEELMNQNSSDDEDCEYDPRTIRTAMKTMPDANLALLSIPGEYVRYETEKLLEQGLNVMIFSDNVSLEDEITLKKKAHAKDLLVMGPDCGTAIISAKPLAFANSIRSGKIGIVGASGTGIQEVSVCIHKLGEGVSHAIGTGGRDLSSEVGGITMLDGIALLAEDPDTEVLVLVSKPPAPEVEQRILKIVSTIKKPVIVNFLGGSQEEVEKAGGIFAATLEEASVKAVEQLNGKFSKEPFATDFNVDEFISQEKAKYSDKQKYIRGFYTGGTLCKEAILALREFEVYSNIPARKELKIADNHKSQRHTVLDLGEDDFTKGRPHPMIDPVSRNERLILDSKDDEVRAFLFDVMLGYGSHEDPAGELCNAINDMRAQFKARNQHVTFIASICGVSEDYQNLQEQKQKLEEAGVIIMPTNARACDLVAKLIC